MVYTWVKIHGTSLCFSDTIAYSPEDALTLDGLTPAEAFEWSNQISYARLARDFCYAFFAKLKDKETSNEDTH